MNRRDLVAVLAERTETDKRSADARCRRSSTSSPKPSPPVSRSRSAASRSSPASIVPRMGRNPQTGEAIRIKASRRVRDAVEGVQGRRAHRQAPGQEDGAGQEDHREASHRQEGGAGQEDHRQADCGEEDQPPLAEGAVTAPSPTVRCADARRPRPARRGPAPDRRSGARCVRGLRRRLLGRARPRARIPVGLLPQDGGGRLGRHRAPEEYGVAAAGSPTPRSSCTRWRAAAAMNGCSALHLTIFGLNPVAVRQRPPEGDVPAARSR